MGYVSLVLGVAGAVLCLWLGSGLIGMALGIAAVVAAILAIKNKSKALGIAGLLVGVLACALGAFMHLLTAGGGSVDTTLANEQLDELEAGLDDTDFQKQLELQLEDIEAAAEGLDLEMDEDHDSAE